MDYNELKIDIDQIPLNDEGIEANLDIMIRHAKYLEQRADINDPLVKDILDTAPSFIFKQLERLKIHIDDETDIIAWLSRSLMELFFMLRYMFDGRNKYDEVIKEQLKDLKDIEKIIYPDGLPSQDAPEEVKTFYSGMLNLWDTVKKYGIFREKLKRPNQAYYYAKGSNLLDEYQRNWKIHSKYVHPTSFIIFGKRDFVYGDGAKQYFLALVQYYAARNLRDLHLMIQAIPSMNNGT